ncbi:MAG TPA: GntR family transcriptional regulator [Stellaceae bacterium]|jgi:GntR family transcriptional regulator of vanillate catabolism|nr:GntR family transcriptional regulator [Stellaceae bacterium]
MTTHQNRAIVQIRELILRGELGPGERITEEGLAERLDMSRTPVRAALPALAREGLLTPSETRGYYVRAFSQQDVIDAIDLRGVLEGMAARLVAERGAPPSLLRDLQSCVEEGDRIFTKNSFADGDEETFAAMNTRFHALIVAAANSRVISDAVTANDRVPFAAAGAVAFDKMPPEFMFALLRYAHRQHHAVVEALSRGQSGRVELLMREHVQPVKDSLNLSPPKDSVVPLFAKNRGGGAV